MNLFIKKGKYDEKIIASFKKRLRKIDWVELKKCEDPNEGYKHFLETLQFIIFSQK